MIKEESSPDRSHPFNFHKCNLCAFRTKSLQVILSHLKKHQSKSKFDRFSCQLADLEALECRLCYFENNLKIATDTHFTLVHESDKREPELEIKSYTCDKCNFITHSILVFARHTCDILLDKSVLKKWFQSEHCPLRSQKIGLKRHAVAHHASLEDTLKYSDEETRFQCEHCPYKARKRENLVKHTKSKHASSENFKLFKCEHCSYECKASHDFQVHLLRKHTAPEDGKWFECAHCSYRNRVKRELKEHILKNHSDPDLAKKFKCEHCSYKTTKKCHLKDHIYNHHTLDKDKTWFKCEECSYKTPWKRFLKVHASSKHNNAKPFECGHCSYKAKVKRNLRSHILSVHMKNK